MNLVLALAFRVYAWAVSFPSFRMKFEFHVEFEIHALLSLCSRRPDVAARVTIEKRFPFGIHGDHGTGLAEDSTLVLTWSIPWGSPDDVRSTWLVRFPFAVLPKSKCLGDGETMKSLLSYFVVRLAFIRQFIESYF